MTKKRAKYIIHLNLLYNKLLNMGHTPIETTTILAIYHQLNKLSWEKHS